MSEVKLLDIIRCNSEVIIQFFNKNFGIINKYYNFVLFAGTLFYSNVKTEYSVLSIV